MGCKASPQGITLTFYDKNGNADPAKAPVFGRFAHLYSTVRPDHPGDPNPQYGSADWLTDVIVADSKADLKAMQPTQIAEHATSASSKKVLVQWKTNEAMSGVPSAGKQANQLTIATGIPPNTLQGQTLLIVDKIDVLPADTVMDPTNRLWQKWFDQRVMIANLAAQAAGKPAQPPQGDASAQASS